MEMEITKGEQMIVVALGATLDKRCAIDALIAEVDAEEAALDAVM